MAARHNGHSPFVTGVEPKSPSLTVIVERTVFALREHYIEAVRATARQEILAELAEDGIVARLHGDTARYNHGLTEAYARALRYLLGPAGAPDLFVDKHEARLTTTEADLAFMRYEDRRYRPFDPDKL
jgi:hypothetical protein